MRWCTDASICVLHPNSGCLIQSFCFDLPGCFQGLHIWSGIMRSKSGKIRYMLWIVTQLNFSEHIRKTTSKAIRAAHALRLLGNSIKGIHQTHARQLYNGAILPVATYGLPVFWKSKNGKVLSALTSMQNKCLCMITGAFQTTNIAMMEIEASIPPIDIWLNYKLNMEALHMACLEKDHPVLCHIALEHRNNTLPLTPPPLPPYDTKKRYRFNPATKITTSITRISNQN